MAYQFVYAITSGASGNGSPSGLWSTTGSSSGTGGALIKATTVGTPTTPGFLPGYAMGRLANGLVVFGASANGTLSGYYTLSTGIELWVTDGTPGGTRQIFAEPDIGAALGTSPDTSAFTGFTAWNNVVLFEYNQGTPNSDILFSTDGTIGNQTTTGTIQLSSTQYLDDSSIGPGEGASTGPYFVYATSLGLWSTNGTYGNQTLLKGTVAGTNTVVGFLPTYQMAALANGKVIFGSGDNGSTSINALTSGIQLWVTDGTAAGTIQIGSQIDASFGQANNTAGFSDFVSIGSRVLFAYQVNTGAALNLCSTDGTAAGFQFTNVNLDATSLGPGEAAATGNGKLIFATGQGVYASDGTQAGTVLLKATTAGTFSALGFLAGTQMATLPNGEVVFGATSNMPNGVFNPNAITNGIQLWVTDGTAAGTKQIYSYIDPGQGSAGDTTKFANFVSVGNGVQFDWYAGTNDNFMFFTDGTNTFTIANNAIDNSSMAVGDGASPICFLPGTRIATPSGEVEIQDLAVGDAVTVLSGDARTIRWIGHGKVLSPRGHRNAAKPVIVRQGAFADNVPNRELHVTKAHSFLVDDVLIPAEYLINHRTIVWDDRAREIEVFHIELDTHDVILANGAPAETYRDDGNRWMFRNANAGWRSPPREPYAPILTGGAAVDAAWRKFLDRSGSRIESPMTDEPDLHLIVDGQRIEIARSIGTDIYFCIPSDPKTVRVRSRSVVPDKLGSARDPRRLGVAIRKIELWRGRSHAAIQANDPRLKHGFHGYEAADDQRWTDGDALLPMDLFDGFPPGTIELVVTLGGTTRYVAPVRQAA